MTPISAPMEGGNEIAEMPLDGGYDMDGFLRYVGWWIAEGHMQMGGPCLSQGVGAMADRMMAEMDRMGIAYKVNTSAPSPKLGKVVGLSLRVYARKHPQFSRWIAENCGQGSANKRIPDMVWSLSARQKQIVFDALMEGDGSPHTGDAWRYTTVSRKLADDVTRLAAELGRPVRMSMRKPGKANHRDQYLVSIGQSTRRQTSIRASRNITHVPYTGKVWCFTTPTGAYVTRRNGRVALQGNSANWFNKADAMLSIFRRDRTEVTSPVDVHVQKTRFKAFGRNGMASFGFDLNSGRYYQIDVNAQEPWQ